MSEPAGSEASPTLALLAGGLATRLGPLTRDRPKSLIEVAGEPFIAHQLRLLAREGVTRVTLCLGYLADQIADVVGDGARFGCQVTYAFDGETPLGTGGALRRALPQLGARFFVMYGDSYLPIAFRPVWEAFPPSGALGLMTVFRNEGRWDSSNVEFSDGVIRRYDKVNKTDAMRHIDYGLGILSAEAVAAMPEGRAWDLADLYGDLARRGQLAAYEVASRFYEIGSTAGIAETDAHLRAGARP
jgi:NDP-sugar pyrophosphorylase family protein